MKLIVLRHGKTEKNKNNPQRKLTRFGSKQIKEVAEILQESLDGENISIITSNKFRAVQTAEILKETLEKKFNIFYVKKDLKIKKSDILSNLITEARQIGISAAEVYLNLPAKRLSSLGIETPRQISKRYERYILNAYKKIKCNIILVGHEGGLDAFLKFQTNFSSFKKDIKHLDYGEFRAFNI